MNHTWQDRWTGNTFTIALLVGPLFACWLAIHFDDMRWLVFTAIWFVFMEGAFVLIPAAYLFVSWWLGR